MINHHRSSSSSTRTKFLLSRTKASSSSKTQAVQPNCTFEDNNDIGAKQLSCVVVYQVRFIATKNGRTDYALAGESIELSCLYMMKDVDEDVKQLIWSKDGKNFLRWRKNKPGLEVLSYTFKGHIDPQSTNSHISIHNVTIDMHGKYKCSVKTDLGTHDMEQDLVVISQTNCKLNDWRVTSQPSECRELFRFDCKGMFPKPVPSCGLWNSKLDKFIRSVMVDISEEPNKQTYRIKYTGKFELQQPKEKGGPIGAVDPINSDLLQYAGHLMFKCDIIVPETSWKLSIVHKMFDFNDGCHLDPLETIERMRHNYSHYAASRMQQDGYLIHRQLDDFEMLASNLIKYEILPPLQSSGIGGSASKSLSSKGFELNCWQKPRIGSLARLSCVTNKSQVKLIGANLLECQTHGWTPVTESSLNNLNSLKQQQQKLSRGRRPPQRPSRRVVGTTTNGADTPPLDIANKHEEEMSTEFSISPVGGSNDLDEPPPSSPSTSTMPSTEVEMIIPTATTTTTTTTQQSSDILTFEHSQSNNVEPPIYEEPTLLSPAQLASLLPTCVSTRRNQPATIGHNRLPLLDEARILESSSSDNKHRAKNENKHKQSSIFNFSSSGSKATTSHHQILASSLLLVIAMSIVNMQQQRQYTFIYTLKRGSPIQNMP